jgi:hypothetical protein
MNTLNYKRNNNIYYTYYYIKKTEEYLQHKLFGSWRGLKQVES